MFNRLFVYCYKLHILIHFSLSVADLALVVVMVVDKCIAYHYMTYNTVEPLWFRLAYPYFWHPIKGIFLCATIYMVVAVSAERFRAICYPFSERHVSNLAILALKNDTKTKKHAFDVFLSNYLIFCSRHISMHWLYLWDLLFLNCQDFFTSN